MFAFHGTTGHLFDVLSQQKYSDLIIWKDSEQNERKIQIESPRKKYIMVEYVYEYIIYIINIGPDLINTYTNWVVASESLASL